MRNVLNPKWLLLFNTLPLLLLAALCYGEYSVIHTLLPAESVALWQQCALAWVGLGLGTLAYAATQLRRGALVGIGYNMLALVAYAAFVLVCLNLNTDLVPGEVPRWMVPMDLGIYIVTFIMPTLAYALFGLVVHFTPESGEHSVGLNFVLAFAAPLLFYMLLTVVFAVAEQVGGSRVAEMAFVTLIGCSAGFLFFVVRAAYIMGLRRADDTGLHLVWKLLISLVLPVLGLLVNGGFGLGSFGTDFGRQERGVFGNFNSPWFYALAVLNAVLLCLPESPRRWPRLLMFLGRSVLLGYTLYFFVVFLPYLPLSILAVILIGTGFLMLAPLLLLVLHVRELATDLAFLATFFSRRWLLAGLVAGGLTLPLVITGLYLYNRRVLHEALAYRYMPDYARTYRLDAPALAQTLTVIKQHKEHSNGFSSSHLPYLSMYFNRLVLDNLTLSDAKIASLEQLFLGAPQPTQHVRRNDDWQPVLNSGFTSGSTVLTGLTTRSTYDTRQQAWVSWLHFTINNTDSRITNGEYATTVALPVGCWVSDYYLDINGRREKGILAEKKSAAWVYAQILSENQNRDPGLLSYLDNEHISLRVFPVAGRVARTTGIQLLHKEPLQLTVDGRLVQLGNPSAQPLTVPVAVPGNAVAYVSAAAKKALPLVQRTPYYHFLLDVSIGGGSGKATYATRLSRQLAAQAADKQSRFTLIDAYATPVAPGQSWPAAVAQHQSTGGFYLDGALRQLLFEAHEQPHATYPVIVVVTDKLEEAILSPDLADMSNAYPESDQFYILAADGQLVAHSLRANSRAALTTVPRPGAPVAVRAWPTAVHPQAYLPDNATADIVLRPGPLGVPVPNAAASRWQTGLLLHGYQQWQAFHPEATEGQRVPFVQASFRAGILTPFTAYLALENDAQKAALRRKQDEVMAANTALDLNESPAPATDVPIDGGASLLLAAGVGFGLRQLRRRRLLG